MMEIGNIKDQEEKSSHNFRCGMVSIVGRPNVGKSTLLNAILGEKVTIVSKVPQTTRNQIRGIYNDERGQIIFIDTPGLYLGKDKLDQALIKTSFATIPHANCVIHLVDTSEPVGREEEEVIRRLKPVQVPIILSCITDLSHRSFQFFFECLNSPIFLKMVWRALLVIYLEFLSERADSFVQKMHSSITHENLRTPKPS